MSFKPELTSGFFVIVLASMDINFLISQKSVPWDRPEKIKIGAPFLLVEMLGKNE